MSGATTSLPTTQHRASTESCEKKSYVEERRSFVEVEHVGREEMDSQPRVSISDRPATQQVSEVVTPNRRDPDGIISMLKESPIQHCSRSPKSDSLRTEMLSHEETKRELQEIRDKYRQAQRTLEEQDGELASARSELRSKRTLIEESDRRADEAMRGMQNGTNLQEKVSELMLENQALERKCQSLEQSLSSMKVRHNELEKLLDDNTSDRNEVQQRHNKQIEALEARLLESEEQRELLSKERVRDFQEQELLRRQEFRSQEQELLRLEQERREQQLDLDHQRRELEQYAAAQDRASAGRDRLGKADKENRRLQEAVHEQKRVLTDVESELRQEKQMQCLPSPGDFARAVRPRDGESLSVQNARHALKSKHLEQNIKVLARHLPPAAWALAQQELEGARSLELLGEGGHS